MSKTLLVADDDKTFHRIISRVFAGTSWRVETAADGAAALDSIASRPPDVILLDLNMPVMSGREVLGRIRGNPKMAMIPVIIISGDDCQEDQIMGSDIQADDYMSKPFDAMELISKVEAAARRSRGAPGENPLTGLPAGPAVESEAARRIKTGVPLAFLSIDIDNFKAYNDSYGYLNGNNPVKCLAGLLADIKDRFSSEDVFIGHMGGDDFAVMAKPGRAEDLAREIAAGFDSMVPGFYSESDRARGFIFLNDRAGEPLQYPLMTLSIAIATNEQQALCHYARIVDITGEIMEYLKTLRSRFGSMYMKDRRSDKE